MKYRKKPVVIEAEQIGSRNLKAVALWCGGQVQPGHGNTNVLSIPTLEGVMMANFGDYIIKGVQGEFYPCKPDIFEATYEPVLVARPAR